MTEINRSQPATKGDLADLRTVLTTDITDLRAELKTDIKYLDQKIDSVAIEVAKTQADVREIKYNIATNMATKGDVSRILNAIDAFTSEAIAYRNHDTLRGSAIMAHDGKLENHETRITLLETTK